MFWLHSICMILHVHLHITFYFFCISAKFVYCGSDKPLWHCKHAFNIKVKCVYAICSSCKLTLETSSARTKRRKRNETSGKCITKDCGDPHTQNHKIWNLAPFADDAYLTVENLSKTASRGLHVPQNCARCERIICNKKVC